MILGISACVLAVILAICAAPTRVIPTWAHEVKLQPGRIEADRRDGALPEKATNLPTEIAPSLYSAEAALQANMPTQCCGRKPAFSDPAYSSVFTGQVAVTTSFAGSGTGFVLEVIDLKNQSTMQVNIGPPTVNPAMYHGPAASQWTKTKLGNVFGLTLDNQGNIYTTATTAYSGDFFPIGATGGEIYKINGGTGAITVFQTLPQKTSPAGLGNINYDCAHQRFYVSDMSNGIIYSLDTGGVIQSTWDHGANLSTPIPDNPAQTFTPLGRRVWGIQAYNGRLYYGVWWEDNAHQSVSQNNEVWSVGLLANGNLSGPAQKEITLPPRTGNQTMPISDISFGPAGTMLVAERSMADETTPDAHQSRILEYTLVSGTWTLLNPSKFKFNPNYPQSSAGGVDYDFAVGGLVWSSGDALHYPTPPASPPENDMIYGILGLPNTGGDTHSSILIDEDGISNYYKTQLGDVEIPCPAAGPSSCIAEFAATRVCPGQATSFTDLSSGASSWNWNFGDNSASNQQNPTHVYATAGSYTVTLSVNGGACTVTHTVNVLPTPPAPVISGPSTTCQSGTYSIPAQSGANITWSVTNGTPISGTGPSINVTWNPSGNGLVSVTVTNTETCCKTTSQLIVHPCDTPSACCEGINVNATFKDFVAVGGGVYTFTPTLTAGPNFITHVSASVISTSLTYSSAICGTNGPVNSYITSATSPAGFTSSLPVPFSRDLEWTASSSAGVNLSGGVTFPFNIQFPAPPGGLHCSDSLTFCIKYTFTDVNCRTCEIIRCYGPFPRGGGIEVRTGSNESGFQMNVRR